MECKFIKTRRFIVGLYFLDFSNEEFLQDRFLFQVPNWINTLANVRNTMEHADGKIKPSTRLNDGLNPCHPSQSRRASRNRFDMSGTAVAHDIQL